MTAEPEHGSSDPGAHDEASPSEWAIPRKSSDWELAPNENTDASPVQSASERPNSESPEALRNRADSLLDEMMLGGADLSAADQGGNGYNPAESAAPNWEERSDNTTYRGADESSSTETRYEDYGDYSESATGDSVSRPATGTGADAPGYTSTNPVDPAPRADSYSDSRSGSSTDYQADTYGSRDTETASHNPHLAGRSADAAAYPSYERADTESDDSDPAGYSPGAYDRDYDADSSRYQMNAPRLDSSPQRAEDTSEPEDTPTPTPEWRVLSGGGDTSQADSARSDTAWNDYVSSYRSPTIADGPVQKWQPESESAPEPDDDIPARNTGADYSDRAGEPRDGLYEPYRTEPPSSQEPDTTSDFAYRGYSNRYYSGNLGDSEPVSESRPVDSETDSGIGYVSSMAVLSGSSRRSTLLPRMSRFDVDKLNREIGDLHEEIRLLLPVGHAQAERAQHLLDKAHTIAASDPERSAEVEYYMQQVRTIVERTRQSRRWSDVYKSRLRFYFMSWTVLSAVTLFALLVGQFEIEAAVANITGVSGTSQLIVNFAGALSAIMAGALGSSIGALVNMSRHARTQYGFFDRKYGLRGLMLPVIGAFSGLVLYAIFGVIYYFTGINPSLSLVAMAVPALLAFLFGLVQESLYGTNE